MDISKSAGTTGSSGLISVGGYIGAIVDSEQDHYHHSDHYHHHEKEDGMMDRHDDSYMR